MLPRVLERPTGARLREASLNVYQGPSTVWIRSSLRPRLLMLTCGPHEVSTEAALLGYERPRGPATGNAPFGHAGPARGRRPAGWFLTCHFGRRSILVTCEYALLYRHPYLRGEGQLRGTYEDMEPYFDIDPSTPCSPLDSVFIGSYQVPKSQSLRSFAYIMPHYCTMVKSRHGRYPGHLLYRIQLILPESLGAVVYHGPFIDPCVDSQAQPSLLPALSNYANPLQ